LISTDSASAEKPIEAKVSEAFEGSVLPAFPAFREPRRTAEKALTAVIQEAYVQGISTRDLIGGKYGRA
jgi:putative transposase